MSGNLLEYDFIKHGVDTAKTVTQEARKFMGTHTGAEYSELAHDWEYAVDAAENLVKKVAKYNIGYVAEGVPLHIPEGAQHVFLTDMDGSRPAQIDLEMSAYTIGIAKYTNGETPTFRDLVGAVVRPLKENATYVVVKDEGAYGLRDNGDEIELEVSPVTELKHAMLSREDFGIKPGNIGLAFDWFSTKEINAPFVFSSSAYSILGVARGKFQAFADPRIRIYEEIGEKRPNKVLFPYDIAGSVTILNEVGGVVTDAYRKKLDDRPLWKFKEKDGQQVWSDECLVSCVAANNKKVHDEVMSRLDKGISLLKDLYPAIKEARKNHGQIEIQF